ncbi:hypothetical protein Back11_19790 [Paenibacillus baekrokdamisoli]|uniref:Uncharacterized protein n=1 Tax=Paenibacillus baekrokdamisoli TaxID=1712516 RepID=A0A3G9JBH8_9BACL|nr:methyl-accepting chemotaxis protein [Paenibacillus baekrokdamisoli]MBB3070017.1 methyl-accepting chemotaxis protein [Paenibacillus baekrokdamisoli]BBH20634.1 hypothetical protein Back11_19790 [Paenibacillus baekrokdamisoli]
MSSFVNWFREHLSVKITASILVLQLLTCLAFAGSGYFVNQQLIGKLLEQFDMRLSTDIQLTSEAVDAIPGSNQELTSMKDPNYKLIKVQLEALKKEHNLENVFILSQSNNKERILILSDVPDDFGTDYPFTSEMKEAIASGKQVISSIYKDEYGIHKSIFQPIRNADGKDYGILGIDLDASVVTKTSSTIYWTTLIISIIMLVVGTIIAILISRLVTKPLHKLMVATNKIAAGDLQEKLTSSSKDEIGKLSSSFAEMSLSLQSVIRQVRSSSTYIADTSNHLYQSAGESSQSAQQVAESSNRMSDGINDIVGSLSHSNVTINEIDHELTDVSQEVNEMQGIALQVRTQSEDGQHLVEQTLHQMKVIQEVMAHSQEAATALGDRSKEIGEIIEIISGISEQTNLLALNASIEAARVGEMGRGFAIVAGEVKKLALQSAEAAQSVASLVSSTQENSQLVIDRITEGNEAVKQGHSWISGTYENFKGIYVGVSHFSTRTDHLIETLRKVEGSFGTISGSMQQISGVTQEQAAGTEEVAAAAQEQSAAIQEITAAISQLTTLSAELQLSVKHYKLSA